MGIRMKAGVLGELRLDLSGRDATPTAQMQRHVLALLLMRESQVVPLPMLIEELWQDEPPRSAVTIVQTYVLCLRKNIAEGLRVSQAEVAAEVLCTSNRGYMFDTGGGFFDLREYRALAEAGQAAIARGDDESAVRLLRDADSLWRGSTLADVAYGMPLAAEIAQLEHARLVNLELRTEAALRLGCYEGVTSELFGLVVRYPFHEKLYAYLMFALCRLGAWRRSVEVFQDLRRAMIDDLGLEPSGELRRLHRDILATAGRRTSGMLLDRHGAYLAELLPGELRVVS